MKRSAPSRRRSRLDVVARVLGAHVAWVGSRARARPPSPRPSPAARRAPSRARTWPARSASSPRSRASSPRGTTSAPPIDDGRQRRSWRSWSSSAMPLLEPGLQVVGPLPGAAEFIRGCLPASSCSLSSVVGAVVPVGDLLGQPVLHGRLGLGRPASRCAPCTSLEVLGHERARWRSQRLLSRGRSSSHSARRAAARRGRARRRSSGR